jgi:hypothetical protein
MTGVNRAGLLIALLHLLVITSGAQQRETVTQGIEWFSATSTLQLNKRVFLMAEGHLRFAQNFEPMQLQIRTGAEITLNKQWSILPLGYVYTGNPLYGKQPADFVNNEHRLFEQMMFKHAAGKIKLSHRVRLEQRFTQVHTVENNEIVDHGYDLYTNRLRYRFQLQFPLVSGSDGAALLSGVFYDEIFISFGDAVTYHGPDQNRIFVGVAYHFSKDLSLQGGPFYQMLVKSGGTKQENNIGVMISLAHSLDLSKD